MFSFQLLWTTSNFLMCLRLLSIKLGGTRKINTTVKSMHGRAEHDDPTAYRKRVEGQNVRIIPQMVSGWWTLEPRLRQQSHLRAISLPTISLGNGLRSFDRFARCYFMRKEKLFMYIDGNLESMYWYYRFELLCSPSLSVLVSLSELVRPLWEICGECSNLPRLKMAHRRRCRVLHKKWRGKDSPGNKTPRFL